MTRKWSLITCTAILAAFLLTGCTSQLTSYSAIELTPVHVPVRNSALPEEVFLTTMPFLDEQGVLLLKEQEIKRFTGYSRAHAALSEFFWPSEEQALTEGLFLKRVELSSDVANVILSGEKKDEESWLKLRAAICMVVTNSEPEIKYVNVYLEDREVGHGGLPLGAVVAPVDISLYSDALMKESAAEDQIMHRTAILYVPDREGKYLVAMPQDLAYVSDATLQTDVVTLINKLFETLQSDEATSEFNDVGLISASVELADGMKRLENVINLVLQGSENVDKRILNAALTLTLTGYIPNIDKVFISYQTGMESASQPQFLSREDSSKHLGQWVTMYYPNQEGAMLFEESILVPQDTVYRPLERLKQLLSHEPGGGKQGFPLLTAADVKDVYVSDGCAVIVWGKGTQEKKDMVLNESWLEINFDRRERMLIFGIVNSLCQIPGISKVFMIEEGNKFLQGQRIALDRPIYYNPGLIAGN